MILKKANRACKSSFLNSRTKFDEKRMLNGITSKIKRVSLNKNTKNDVVNITCTTIKCNLKHQKLFDLSWKSEKKWENSPTFTVCLYIEKNKYQDKRRNLPSNNLNV